jgi:FkbM family methyltransferase
MSSSNLLERLWALRKWKRLTSVLLRHLRISHLFTVHTSGIRIRFYPTVWNINLWENPETFKDDTDFLYQYLRSGDTVVDLGANIGLISLVASRIVGSIGFVYSFEPHPRTYRFLLGNIDHNQAANVRSFNYALGNKDGDCTFTDQRCDDGNHIIFGKEGISVPVRKLDTLLPGIGRVHLLKIDVEGFEKFAFEGAKRVLSLTRCVYFESSSFLFGRYGYTTADVLAFLENEGFTVYRKLSPVELKALPPNYDSQNIENLIAVRDIDEFVALTGFTIV